jgi:hypothetical protein
MDRVTVKRLPGGPLLFVLAAAGAWLSTAILLATLGGCWLGAKDAYDWLYQVAIPLLSSVVTITVSLAIYHLIPQTRERRRAAMDLFSAYYTDDFKSSRVRAWTHYVTERRGVPGDPRPDRLVTCFRFITDPSTDDRVDSAEHLLMQDLSQVLNFFVLVELQLEQKLADESLVGPALGHYYAWWRDWVIAPLREMRSAASLPADRMLPQWIKDDGLARLDRLIGQSK